MAIGAAYATTAELETRLRGEFPTSVAFDTVELQDALNTASRGIESVCERQFNTDASAAVRIIPANRVISTRLALVDDFHTITGLVIESDDTGTGTSWSAWTASEYQLEPLGGVVDGRDGWPFTRIRAVDYRTFPRHDSGRAALRVTARWGWAAVPAAVKTSCLIAAVEIWKLKDAPFGVAGVGEWGTLRVRENPMIMKKLSPYVRSPVKA